MAMRDDEYLLAYVANELRSVFESGLPKAALLALQPIVTYQSPTVRESIIELLVRGRHHDPDMVEDLLLQDEFPEEIRQRVLAYPSRERLSDLMIFQSANILYDLFLMGSRALRLELQWLMLQALKLPTLEGWLKLIVQEIINLLAGEVVFAVPSDAPSRTLYGHRKPSDT